MNGLRIRLFLAGTMVLEEWIDDPALALAAGQRHMELAVDADQPWLLEIFDPDAPTDTAYIRFGSDPAGMVDPMPLEPPIDLERALGLNEERGR
jgi:hypothetical protein